MSDATFATVREADYPALRSMMPSSTPETYSQWVFALYRRMVEHQSGGDHRAMPVEISPTEAAHHIRGNGSGEVSLTDIDNYAHSLGRPFVDTDPEEFWRRYGDETTRG